MNSWHGPIYINGRFLNTPVTGVQRVAIELMAAFERIRGSQFTYLTPPGAVYVRRSSGSSSWPV